MMPGYVYSRSNSDAQFAVSDGEEPSQRQIRALSGRNFQVAEAPFNSPRMHAIDVKYREIKSIEEGRCELQSPKFVNRRVIKSYKREYPSPSIARFNGNVSLNAVASNFREVSRSVSVSEEGKEIIAQPLELNDFTLPPIRDRRHKQLLGVDKLDARQVAGKIKNSWGVNKPNIPRYSKPVFILQNQGQWQ